MSLNNEAGGLSNRELLQGPDPQFSLVVPMCNLYSITTNQAAISALFRVVNQYVGNLAPMPGRISGL